jgi:RNA polymerase sigma factor (sigma-70 family)
MTDSQTLFAEYVRTGSETAFRELVTRYVDLVYSTALRMVEGDTHRAEDVAQVVFVDLARAARTLSSEVMLGGWLHRHTCFVAAKTMRGERRRQSRERQAVEMNALQDNPGVNFSLVAPILDEAINELGEADRTAVLLRFFEQHDFHAVGEALGSNEDAARMRVTRALNKLQGLLKRRGVTTSAATLSVVLSANAVQAAPAGLAATLTSASLAGVAMGTGTTLALLKLMAVTKLQLGIICSLVVAVGTLVAIRHNTARVAMPDQVRGASSGLRSTGQSNGPNGPRPSWLAKARRIPESQAPDPMYLGKTLDEWVAELISTNQPLREAAHEAFKAMGDSAAPAIPALATVLHSSRNQNAAAWALVFVGTDSLPTLIDALTDGSPVARMEVAGAIGSMRDRAEAAVPALVECMRHPYWAARCNAINSLQSIAKQPDLVVPAVTVCLTDTNTNVRVSAATLLRYFGNAAGSAVPALAQVAREDADALVRTRAAESLREISPERANTEGL